MIQKWPKLHRKELGNYRIFNLVEQQSSSPRTGKPYAFFIMEAQDWVNVIPVTPEGQVVLIRQYRHGSEAIELEIPGGIVDATDSSPAEAALRELVEETGYQAETIIQLGSITPNPAILNNRCHTFLALNARYVRKPVLDSGEDIAVELADLKDIPRLIGSGQITHALVVAAFYHLIQYQIEYADSFRQE